MKKLFFLFSFFIIANFSFCQKTKNIKNGSENEKWVYVVVEEPPMFNYNGNESIEKSFESYIFDNLKNKSDNCNEKVFINFIVEPDGSTSEITSVKVIKNCSNEIENIKSIIKTMPKWTPGKQNKKNVRVSKTMTINFKKEKNKK